MRSTIEKKVHINTWVTPDMAKLLEKEDRMEGVSRSAIIRKALGYFLIGEAGYNRRTTR